MRYALGSGTACHRIVAYSPAPTREPMGPRSYTIPTWVLLSGTIDEYAVCTPRTCVAFSPCSALWNAVQFAPEFTLDHTVRFHRLIEVLPVPIRPACENSSSPVPGMEMMLPSQEDPNPKSNTLGADHVEPLSWLADCQRTPCAGPLELSKRLPSIALTSSRERTSAEAEGYRIERAPMDCVAPPF